MVKEIILANDRGVAICDDEYFEAFNKYKWHIDPGGYARRSEHLGMVNGKRKVLLI